VAPPIALVEPVTSIVLPFKSVMTLLILSLAGTARGACPTVGCFAAAPSRYDQARPLRTSTWARAVGSVFYAPSIGHDVVSRHGDIEQVFRDVFGRP
jgi:hypothetical protein